MNTQQRANEMKEYWTGTLHEQLIQMYQDNKDEVNLLKAVAEAESEASMQEIHGANIL
jgi:phage baseplate assembly protein gpV